MAQLLTSNSGVDPGAAAAAVQLPPGGLPMPGAGIPGAAGMMPGMPGMPGMPPLPGMPPMPPS